MSEPILVVDDVRVTYPLRGWRKSFQALKGVSLDIHKGETVGLVGESGSGKSTLGRAILGLAPITGGSITYKGRDITHASGRERRRLGSEIQVVFQDPYSSLNPAFTIEEILTEPLSTRSMTRRDAQKRVRELLDQVRLPENAMTRFPWEFSGGQRQRVAIARALALEPELIVCDEPVSALDLSTQKRVLSLFRDVQEATGVAYLFVSHDLEVVRALSHEISVMYRGEIVEHGTAEAITDAPQHPYTRRLLMAAPLPHPDRQRARREERAAVAAQEAATATDSALAI
jgi:ABC-type glutathione transport system ATPase component